MTNVVITEGFVKRFQEWDKRIDKQHLIWIIWALALDENLQAEVNSIVDQLRTEVRNEMKKLDGHSP